MRERLVVAFALVTALVLVVFTLARAYSTDALVTTTEARKLERSVVLVAALAHERRVNAEPVTSRYLMRLLNEGEQVEYDAPGAAPVVATGPGFSAAAPDGDLVRAARVPGDGGTVTMRRSGALVERRVDERLLPLVLLGMLLVAIAAGLGYVAARMLARPFQDLERHALALGRGRFDLEVPRYRVPEADTVGQALQTSAAALRDLLRRERDLATEASHELRTPITALRLELEDLALDGGTPEPVATQVRRSLEQVDRLSATVDHLLERSRGRRTAEVGRVDVGRLAEEAARRASGRAGATGRDVSAVSRGPAVVHLPPGPIDQLLDLLVDDALTHGRGPVVMEAWDAGDHVQVRVSDDGETRAAEPGGGAAEIAEALGGRLSPAREPGGGYSLKLPHR